MSPGNVLSEVRHKYDELTQSQKRIAESIVEDPEFVAFATVDKLAIRLGVSASTIVRFAYKLGLDGYNELQERVRDVIRNQITSNQEPVDTEGWFNHLGDSIFQKSLEHDVRLLQRTIAALDVDVLNEAVDIVLQSSKRYVCGGLTTFSVAHFVAMTLGRVCGETTLLSGTDGTVALQLSTIGPGDALLAFTFPPYASQTMRVVKLGKELGAKVIAVTDSLVSPIAKSADVIIPCKWAGLTLQNSLVPLMAIANLLTNGVIAKAQDATLERYGRLNQVLNEWKVFLLHHEEAERSDTETED